MRMLNTKEAAYKLGVHPNTIYKKVKEGSIIHVDFGRRKRFPVNHDSMPILREQAPAKSKSGPSEPVGPNGGTPITCAGEGIPLLGIGPSFYWSGDRPDPTSAEMSEALERFRAEKDIGKKERRARMRLKKLGFIERALCERNIKENPNIPWYDLVP